MSQDLIKNNDEQFMTINRAELDVQISTAKAYPRSIEQAIGEAIDIIASDRETAESCFFCLPRAGKELKGPSVRLAEIIAYTWGNIHAAIRIIGNDGRQITAEGVAWDLQKNVKISSEVKRSIRNKSGQMYNLDMQQTTGNAACSIALRNAIFRVIPKHIVNKLYEIAITTAVGDVKSLKERRQKSMAYFQKLGIAQDKILSYFGLSSLEDITLEHIESLLGISNAIRDGMITIENAFSKSEVLESSSNVDELNDILEASK